MTGDLPVLGMQVELFQDDWEAVHSGGHGRAYNDGGINTSKGGTSSLKIHVLHHRWGVKQDEICDTGNGPV